MKGIINEDIVFDGKRNISKEAYAKSYAQGSKDRVALLAVCKEVRAPNISVLARQLTDFSRSTTKQPRSSTPSTCASTILPLSSTSSARSTRPCARASSTSK